MSRSAALASWANRYSRALPLASAIFTGVAPAVGLLQGGWVVKISSECRGRRSHGERHPWM